MISRRRRVCLLGSKRGWGGGRKVDDSLDEKGSEMARKTDRRASMASQGRLGAAAVPRRLGSPPHCWVVMYK